MLLNEWEIIGVGFAVAFTTVRLRPRIKLFQRKPFNCVPCSEAWATLWAAVFAGYKWEVSLLFIPIGYTVGCIFEAIKMRYL